MILTPVVHNHPGSVVLEYSGTHFNWEDELKTTMNISERLVNLDLTRVILGIALQGLNVNYSCTNRQNENEYVNVTMILRNN